MIEAKYTFYKTSPQVCQIIMGGVFNITSRMKICKVLCHHLASSCNFFSLWAMLCTLLQLLHHHSDVVQVDKYFELVSLESFPAVAYGSASILEQFETFSMPSLSPVSRLVSQEDRNKYIEAVTVCHWQMVIINYVNLSSLTQIDTFSRVAMFDSTSDFRVPKHTRLNVCLESRFS